MYEELYKPLPEPELYLKKLGLEGMQIKYNAQCLSRIIYAQLTHIPFDTIDVWHKKLTSSLDTKDLFNKIIIGNRGGYCFELNRLFCTFLQSLGFDAFVVSTRIILGIDYLPPAGHCSVVCKIDGKSYFCDVGYGGDVPRSAVLIDGQESQDGFSVKRENGVCILYSAKVPGDGRVMVFKEQPVDPIDLVAPNFYATQHPGSPFRAHLLVNLGTDDGANSLTETDFKIHAAGKTTVIEIKNLLQITEILREYFGIDYTF